MTGSFPSRRQRLVRIALCTVLPAMALAAVSCSIFSPAPVATTPAVEDKNAETIPPEESAQQTRAPEYLMHTIQYTGETLSAIARWYTGDVRNWRAIARANPTLDPKRMRIGDTIHIPEEMVINRKPMPAVKTASKRTVDPPPAQPKVDKKLFGPIETPASSSENQLFGPVDSEPPPARDEGLARPLEKLD